MFSLLKQTETSIYELGSGWGNVIFPLAKTYPHAQVHAYEGSWIPWFFSFTVHKILRQPNLTLVRKDFFSVSLCEADIVVCYLYPGAMKRLKQKFQNELKSGACVITNTFAIPEKEPEEIVQVGDLWRSQIYVYRF